jgi:hypothetical protein
MAPLSDTAVPATIRPVRAGERAEPAMGLDQERPAQEGGGQDRP